MSPAEFRVIIVFEVLPKEIKKQKQTLNPSFSTSTLLSQRWSAIPLVDIWDVFSQLVLQLSMRFHRYQVLTRCSTDYQQRSRLRCVLDPALDVHARLTHHGIWTTQRRGRGRLIDLHTFQWTADTESVASVHDTTVEQVTTDPFSYKYD